MALSTPSCSLTEKPGPFLYNMPITCHFHWNHCLHTTQDFADCTKHRVKVHDHKFIPGKGFNRAPPSPEPHERELRHDEAVDHNLVQEQVKYWKGQATDVRLGKILKKAQDKMKAEGAKADRLRSMCQAITGKSQAPDLPPNASSEEGLLRVGLVNADGNTQGVYLDPKKYGQFHAPDGGLDE